MNRRASLWTFSAGAAIRAPRSETRVSGGTQRPALSFALHVATGHLGKIRSFAPLKDEQRVLTRTQQNRKNQTAEKRLKQYTRGFRKSDSVNAALGTRWAEGRARLPQSGRGGSPPSPSSAAGVPCAPPLGAHPSLGASL